MFVRLARRSGCEMSIAFARRADITGLGYHPAERSCAWYWRGLSDDVLGPHIVMCCEHGALAGLGLGHKVAADGEITPSIVWMRYDEAAKKNVEGCCHVHGHLVGWTEADSRIQRRPHPDERPLPEGAR